MDWLVIETPQHCELALPSFTRLFTPSKLHQQASASTTIPSTTPSKLLLHSRVHPLRSRSFISQIPSKMSGASTYLQKMRKAELVELADSVDFKEWDSRISSPSPSRLLTFHRYDGLRKTELEAALDVYLTQNATKFLNESRLAPFYKRSSPVKKESMTSTALAEIDSKVKSVKRRVTKAAEELVATYVTRRDARQPSRGPLLTLF